MMSSLLFRIVAFHLACVTGVAVWFLTGGSAIGFIAVLLLCLFLQFIGTIGFHRWLAHRSFEPTLFGKVLLMVGMLVESFGRPIISATVHRSHHLYSDKQGDPHSPKFISFFDMMLGKYHQPEKLPPIRDLLRQKDIMWFDNHYWKLWILLNVIICLIDWRLVLLICPIAFCKSWFGNQHINYFAHGGKKCEPTNSNNMLLLLFSGGEHYHANHHDRPGNWKFGKYDISALIIDKLKIRKVS